MPPAAQQRLSPVAKSQFPAPCGRCGAVDGQALTASAQVSAAHPVDADGAVGGRALTAFAQMSAAHPVDADGAVDGQRPPPTAPWTAAPRLPTAPTGSAPMNDYAVPWCGKNDPSVTPLSATSHPGEPVVPFRSVTAGGSRRRSENNRWDGAGLEGRREGRSLGAQRALGRG